MNKIFTLIVAFIACCLSAFAAPVLDTASGLYYELTDSKSNPGLKMAVIVPQDNANVENNYPGAKNIKIPAQIKAGTKTYSVIGIAQQTFRNHPTLEKVYNDERCLLIIGANAFAGCTNLKSVDLSTRGVSSLTPAQLATLADAYSQESGDRPFLNASAFSGCTSLESVKLPMFITQIGQSAFKNCSSLTSVNLEDLPYLVAFGNECFANCTSLENLFLGEKIKTFGQHVFLGCSKLSYIEWQVKSLADFAEGTSPFYDLKDNEVELEVECTGDMKRVPAYLFYGMKNLSYSWMMEEIGAHAYDGCTQLMLPTYLINVKKIEEAAFNGMKGNSIIYLPATPIDIYDENVFGTAGLDGSSTFIVYNGDCDANAAYKTAAHWDHFEVLSRGSWRDPAQESMVLDEHPTGAGTSMNTWYGNITKVATCDDPTFTVVVNDEAVAECYDADNDLTTIPFGYVMYNGEKVYSRTATFEQIDNDTKVYIVYTADVPDAVDNIVREKTPYRKVVRDGMILIEHNNKTYNLLGAEIQ